MIILVVSCIIALILLTNFRTEAWVEYCQLLHLNFLSKYKGYQEKKANDLSLEYLGYLRRFHNCFFVRLITCPICFSIWLGIIAGLLTFSFIFIPVYIIAGLSIFAIIDRLLK